MVNEHDQRQQCYPELVIASGAKNKLDAANNLYGEYSFYLVGIDPEKAYGVHESEAPFAGQVAYEKTEAILDHYNEPRYLVMGADICTWVWKEGESLEQAVELKKAIRNIDPQDTLKVEAAVKEAQVQARQLYCNGKFYVLWDVGIVMQSSDHSYKRGVILECMAEFDQGIPEEVVAQATATDKTLYDSTFVNLAKQAGVYATTLTVRNKGEIGVEWMASPQLIEEVVHGGVLNKSLFAQLVDPGRFRGEKDGELFEQVYLNFENSAI
ncbi:hypothetical protein C5B42_03565 [Candidatus Cerribacteria bacterium 'Amazon FNV 2010 28 9']|uniref:Uncharacterized protein n=1 Tax=Candidatus Cerribacteria bacterium 'Amazon FNV 2010 28 9' TaxID=2081795 RepID=A0A317JPU4_9BACT|nr:MAG: hypothetical protein C5B42_03565 [Candidatus Cerribacteria bacterium 'Amazon FNV 2010 28 9']